MDQRAGAYQLDRKSLVRFYLRIFFNLLDIACVNSFLVYIMKHPKQLTLLNYKIVIAKNLIRWHQIRQRAVPLSRSSKTKSTSVASNDHGGHYKSLNQHVKDVPIIQKKEKKIELLYCMLSLRHSFVSSWGSKLFFKASYAHNTFSIVKIWTSIIQLKKIRKPWIMLFKFPFTSNPEGHQFPLMCPATQN